MTATSVRIDADAAGVLRDARRVWPYPVEVEPRQSHAAAVLREAGLVSDVPSRSTGVTMTRSGLVVLTYAGVLAAEACLAEGVTGSALLVFRSGDRGALCTVTEGGPT